MDEKEVEVLKASCIYYSAEIGRLVHESETAKQVIKVMIQEVQYLLEKLVEQKLRNQDFKDNERLEKLTRYYKEMVQEYNLQGYWLPGDINAMMSKVKVMYAVIDEIRPKNQEKKKITF